MQSPEGLTISGKIIVRSHPAGTLHLYDSLVQLGRNDLARELIEGGKIEIEQKNLIVDSSNYGIDILIQYLISGYTGSLNFSLGPSWGEIGTGMTTPALSDTALTTPTNRASVSYAYDSAFNTAVLQFFFPDSVLANENYYEFGTFGGSTASSVIGSGNMFNHALFASAYSKSAGSDTTVEVDIAIANS
jgi:hypothetical protein